MPSKNVTSGDNQQERLKTACWIVGFVDGEGTFSVSIFRNQTTRIGWQVFPEFIVTQGEKNRSALELIKDFFGCGYIYRNRKPRTTHREDIYRYCVRSLRDLDGVIIPFFKKFPLKTKKRTDFQKLVKVVERLNRDEHLSVEGLERIAKLVQSMNKKVPSQFLESSETIRQTLN